MIQPFYKKRWEAYLNMLLFYFDNREQIPEIDWKEFDYTFVMSRECETTQMESDLKGVVEGVLSVLS